MLVKVHPQDSESQTKGLSPEISIRGTEKMVSCSKGFSYFFAHVSMSEYLCDYEDGS